MTDLADLLVREYDLDFRDAHEIIALVVNQAIYENMTSDKISVDMIRKAAKQHIDKEIAITKQQLEEALDPVKSVRRKTNIGNPAPSAVQIMIQEATDNLSEKI